MYMYINVILCNCIYYIIIYVSIYNIYIYNRTKIREAGPELLKRQQ